MLSGSQPVFSYPCWTCHRDGECSCFLCLNMSKTGINAILREVDKYFLQMKNHRKSRLCARSAVREMTSEKLQVTGESECLRQ
ncbi:unnamed protein product [Dicrocoelium dendriticum]|nr:unnamed protein product [Dicrocoelium dendriticum]